MYIGVTSQKPTKRWRNGKGYQHNPYFNSAIKKYGWENFEHEIVLVTEDKTMAYNQEIALINLYQSTNPNFGYNISSGGSGGREGVKLSEEAKQTISRKNKGRLAGEKHPNYGKHIFLGSDNPFFNRKHTEETRQLISLKATGRKVSEAMRQKISMSTRGGNNPRAKTTYQYDKNYNLLKIWSCAKDAADDIGISKSIITACCRGKSKSAGKYLWSYEPIKIINEAEFEKMKG